jgi:hypothetical protein
LDNEAEGTVLWMLCDYTGKLVRLADGYEQDQVFLLNFLALLVQKYKN